MLFEVQRCSASCVAHANSVFWRFVVCMQLTRQNSNQGMQPCSQCKCANIWPALKCHWCDRVCAFQSPATRWEPHKATPLDSPTLLSYVQKASFIYCCCFGLKLASVQMFELSCDVLSVESREAVRDKMAFSWSFLSLNFSPLFFFNTWQVWNTVTAL